MTTSIRYSGFEEKLLVLNTNLELIKDIVKQLEEIIAFKNSIIDNYPSGLENVETLLNAMLAQNSDSALLNYRTHMSNLFTNFVYDAKTFPYFREMMFDPESWKSTKITVSDSTFTINQSTVVAIFDVISTPAGGFTEQVEVYEAENPVHNGLYDISSTTDQTLVVANPSLKGKDNLTDKSVKIRPISRQLV